MNDAFENSLAEFFNYIKPFIIDLDILKKDLLESNKELEQISDFVFFVSNDIYKVGSFSNQALIHRHLKFLETNSDKYKAMLYMMEGNRNFKAMPQYNEAVNYFKNIIEYFVIKEKELKEHIDKVEVDYNKKLIAEKYLKLFKDPKAVVEDTSEFITFVTNFRFPNSVKRDVLALVIRNNVKAYKKYKPSDKFRLEPDKGIEDVNQLIFDNKKLITEDYISLMEVVNEKINLALDLEEIINEDLLKKININNLILSKKVWLMKKIVDNYKISEFKKVNKFVKEFNKLLEKEKLVRKTKDQKEQIRIIAGGC